MFRIPTLVPLDVVGYPFRAVANAVAKLTLPERCSKELVERSARQQTIIYKAMCGKLSRIVGKVRA